MSHQQNMRICPFCSEAINAGAVKCRYCHEWMPETEENHQYQRMAHQPAPHHMAFEDAAMPTTPVVVGSGRRAAAWIIDLAVMWIMIFVAVFSFGILAVVSGDSSVEDDAVDSVWLLFVLAFIFYPAIAEAKAGATLGKRMLGLRVVREDGSKLDGGSAFVRSLFRLVDLIPWGLIGIILIETSAKKQRLGDRIAHTVVIRS